MDQRTRKLMTIHKALHPRSDVDRLYVSRKEAGRELASNEDSVNASIQRLEDYTQKRKRLITATRNDSDNPKTSRTTITRKQRWEEKQLYGRFKRFISNISNEKMWTCLRKGNLKRKTDSLLIAAQNNVITNHIEVRLDKTPQNSKCRLWGDRDETINHMISECSKLAQKECKTRPDRVAKVIHWKMCKKMKFDQTNKRYMHNPESVQENDIHKLQWDIDIQTDHLISPRKREVAKLWTLLARLTTE